MASAICSDSLMRWNGLDAGFWEDCVMFCVIVFGVDFGATGQGLALGIDDRWRHGYDVGHGFGRLCVDNIGDDAGDFIINIFPSNVTLAARAKVSKDTAIRGRFELEDMGILIHTPNFITNESKWAISMPKIKEVLMPSGILIYDKIMSKKDDYKNDQYLMSQKATLPFLLMNYYLKLIIINIIPLIAFRLR